MWRLTGPSKAITNLVVSCLHGKSIFTKRNVPSLQQVLGEDSEPSPPNCLLPSSCPLWLKQKQGCSVDTADMQVSSLHMLFFSMDSANPGWRKRHRPLFRAAATTSGIPSVRARQSSERQIDGRRFKGCLERLGWKTARWRLSGRHCILLLMSGWRVLDRNAWHLCCCSMLKFGRSTFGQLFFPIRSIQISGVPVSPPKKGYKVVPVRCLQTAVSTTCQFMRHQRRRPRHYRAVFQAHCIF